ncbi:MAG: ferritin-like domain-containing protein [Bacteroidales bacterium]
MLKEKVEKALIDQIQLEEQSSRIYMAMASWCEVSGFSGCSQFFVFPLPIRERMHMTRLIKYVNDKGRADRPWKYPGQFTKTCWMYLNKS